ncbi:MAG: hypothetical protein ACR2GN_06300 [Bacteroidia bacterium]
MRIYFLLFFFIVSLHTNAQNYLDSLINSRGVCYLSLVDLGKMGIKELKIYTFLSEEEIRRLPSKKDLKSKVLVYKFDTTGRLKEVVKNYSGVDSIGVNRLAATGDKDDVLINGMIYYYDKEGKITSTLSYGAGVNPNSGYIYDHEGQLVMIRYYFDKVMHKYSESAGRTIFDYYPQNGRIKYKIKLNNHGAIESADYYIYDNIWNLKGVSNSPEPDSPYRPYAHYATLGYILLWQVTINNIPVNNFLFNNKIGNCVHLIIQATPDEYYFFSL